MLVNLITKRGLKKLAYGRFLQLSRYRKRKGLAPPVTASGPLTEDYDWSFPDGTPGQLNRSQSLRYIRDQEFGRTMIDFHTRLEQVRDKVKLQQASDQVSETFPRD